MARERLAPSQLDTPAFRKIVATAPDYMRDLTELYRDHNDYNDRVKIKVRIKILLDLLSVDTAYPAELPKSQPGMNRINVHDNNGMAAPLAPAVNVVNPIAQGEGRNGNQDQL